MTFAEFLAFLIAPAGALIIGYLALRKSERDSARFDKKRDRHAH